MIETYRCMFLTVAWALANILSLTQVHTRVLITEG